MADSVNADVRAYLKALSSPPTLAPGLSPESLLGGSVFYPPGPKRLNAAQIFTAPVTGLTGFDIDTSA